MAYYILGSLQKSGAPIIDPHFQKQRGSHYKNTHKKGPSSVLKQPYICVFIYIYIYICTYDIAIYVYMFMSIYLSIYLLNSLSIYMYMPLYIDIYV